MTGDGARAWSHPRCGRRGAEPHRAMFGRETFIVRVAEIIERPAIRTHAFVRPEEIEVSTERSDALPGESSSGITLRGARG